MTLSLTKPTVGSTGWGSDVNQNFEDIENAVKLPTNYIGGLKLSNNSSDPGHDVDVAAGQCRDAADSADMELSSTLTKRIDASWSVGTNQGGLDAGGVASDTLYAVWLIKRSDTGVVDALFSTSFTSPTMPTDYDKKRLVGAVCTDSSADIVSFIQQGDYFRYKDPVREIDGTTISSWTDQEIHVPPDCLAVVYGYADWNGGASGECGGLWLRPKGCEDDSGSYAEAFCGGCYHQYFRGHFGRGDVLVDSDSRIQCAASGGSIRVWVTTIGFWMLTRGEP